MPKAAMKVRHPNKVRHSGYGRLVGRSRLPCRTCVRVPGSDVSIGTWMHCPDKGGCCEVKIVRFGPKGTHYTTGDTNAGPWVNAIATRRTAP